MWFWRARDRDIPTSERAERIEHLRDLIRVTREEQLKLIRHGCPLTADRAGESLERYWAALRELEGDDAVD